MSVPRLPGSCFFLLVGVLLAISVGAEPPSAANTKSVKLVIDYGDGVEKHFSALGWREEMTVLDLLRAGQAHPRGIRIDWKGSGATALLVKIDDVANEGNGRSWIYRVNGKLAEVSCGVKRLSAGDVVLWKFEVYR